MEQNWLTIENKDGEVVLTKCSKDAEGEIVIPEGVTRIGSRAFECCERLTSIHLPNSVTSIGQAAFFCCKSLVSIVIPEGVTTIGSQAFDSCERLSSIHLPNSVTSINDSTFFNCKSLTSIIIPEGITVIGVYAFTNSGLTSIVIPDSVTCISDCAFKGCKSLQSITIPDCKIGTAAFGGSNSYWDPSCPISSIRCSANVKGINNKDLFHRDLSVLDFMGSIPETNNVFEGISIGTLRVNTSRKNTIIPKDIISALHLDDYKNRGNIIYAAPELCEELSIVPGYIKVTKESNDEFVDINTKYIVSVEPYEIERYHSVTGSLITYAADGMERSHQIVVYEPCDMVLQKIEDSLEALSQKVGGVAGLLNQLETLCRKKEQ